MDGLLERGPMGFGDLFGGERSDWSDWSDEVDANDKFEEEDGVRRCEEDLLELLSRLNGLGPRKEYEGVLWRRGAIVKGEVEEHWGSASWRNICGSLCTA